jgi:hypothetical protein
MKSMTLDYALKEGFVDLRLTGVNPATGGMTFEWDIEKCPENPFHIDASGRAIINGRTADFTIIDYKLLDAYGVKKQFVIADYEEQVNQLLAEMSPEEETEWSLPEGEGSWPEAPDF